MAAGVLLAILAGAVVLALIFEGGGVSADSSALAQVGMPLGGGHVQSVSVVSGPHSEPVPVSLRDGRLWPAKPIAAGEQVSIQVKIKRAGWIAWLTGATERLQTTLRTPTASLADDYLTLSAGAPIRVHFLAPVTAVSYGATPTRLVHQALPSPQTEVTLPRGGAAGSLWIAGAPRSWESPVPTLVSWFATGAATSAVASPPPGSPISPTTPIALTFSKPVAQALGSSRPPVSPTTPGSWQQVSTHTIVFNPQGGGYGVGASVTVALPGGVRLVGAAQSAAGTVAHWQVPPGSTLRLQQLLAELGYLPLTFQPQGPAIGPTPGAQEDAAVHPPPGSFTWRYPNVPSALRSMWAPGAQGEMTRGAVMAFENDHGLNPAGNAGPGTWRALIAAAVAGKRSTFGYSFVDVDKNAQRLTLWHSGRTVLTTPVNTGIAQQPTASGTFPVYAHLSVTTMSGTNPDGSQYSDPGIQYVSYFNGGDALHAFTRAQYGSPQSLGCVEMPLGPARAVWPYTPIGTLVHVH